MHVVMPGLLALPARHHQGVLLHGDADLVGLEAGDRERDAIAVLAGPQNVVGRGCGAFLEKEHVVVTGRLGAPRVRSGPGAPRQKKRATVDLPNSPVSSIKLIVSFRPSGHRCRASVRNRSLTGFCLRSVSSFPAGKHDDQVDALGLVGQLLDKMSTRQRLKPPDVTQRDG